jgi:hypothetical protein
MAAKTRVGALLRFSTSLNSCIGLATIRPARFPPCSFHIFSEYHVSRGVCWERMCPGGTLAKRRVDIALQVPACRLEPSSNILSCKYLSHYIFPDFPFLFFFFSLFFLKVSLTVPLVCSVVVGHTSVCCKGCVPHLHRSLWTHHYLPS